MALSGNLNGPVYVSHGVRKNFVMMTSQLRAGLAYLKSRLSPRHGTPQTKAPDIGGYELLSRIGEGGMGEVWVARHLRLGRPVAIKMIRPDLLARDTRSHETAIARFEREATATAALSSPHTVAIHDFGVTPDGAFYYVMELLEGLSLDTLVRRFGPIAPPRTVELIRQVCHSLGEAHASGLIHRDIKPANIFVCRLGLDFDFVKVLDFGLVKQSVNSDLTPVSVEGMTAGTPAYMAPEVAMGAATIDGRADIYALGCVAYWMLTGQEVFAEPTQMATLLAHVESTPVPPSARTEVRIPAPLEAAIMACLSKSPADRPSAAELDRRLASCEACGSWTADSARAWWNVNHLPAGISFSHS